MYVLLDNGRMSARFFTKINVTEGAGESTMEDHLFNTLCRLAYRSFENVKFNNLIELDNMNTIKHSANR